MNIDNTLADKLIQSQAEQISLLKEQVRILNDLIAERVEQIRLHDSLLNQQQELNDRQQKWIDEP